jgi:hypothetical protein
MNIEYKEAILIFEKKEIIIRKIENTKDEYFAYFKNDFLQSTYSIFFNDSIFGAVALNRFYEMIRNHFELKNLTLSISNEFICFKNKALLEEITKIETREQEASLPVRGDYDN